MPLHPYQFIPRTFSSPLTLRTGSSLTLDDNVTLGLGTSDGESTVKSDGTSTIWTVGSGKRLDLTFAGSGGFQYSTGALAFQEATTISTTATTLTLAPNTDVHISDGKGLVIGHTAQNAQTGVTPELQVLGTNFADSGMVLGQWSNTAGNAPALYVIRGRGTSISGTTIVNDADVLFDLNIYAADGSATSDYVGGISVRVNDAAPAEGAIGSAMFFLTSTAAGTVTEALRITAGQVLTTLAAYPANVTAAQAGIFGGGIAFTDVLNAWIDDATHGTGTVVHYIGNNTIDTTAPSDVRLKDNIGPLNALDVLRRLPVIEFESKYWGPGRHGGFDAQAAGRVLPNLAVQDTQGYWRFQGHLLMPYVVGGIQDIVERVEALEKENHELRALVAGRSN